MATTSRPTVRVGVAQFFGGTTYDQEARAYRGSTPVHLFNAGLSTVRAYQSKRISDKDYVLGQAKGRGMGASMIVEMPDDTEIRRAVPAAGPGTNYVGSGRKRITYTVILHVFHLAHKPHMEDAEADVDNLLEEVKSQVRSDVSLGGICYQAGENGRGIRTHVYPSNLGTDEITATHATVTFEAEVEIVS
jgi:hypothetical protein